MSEKFDLSHSTYKYNISPSQLLSKPPPLPPPPPPPSSNPSTRTRPRDPNPSPTPPIMPVTDPTYHLVPAFDSPSSIVDDDDAASFPATTRLINPSMDAASIHAASLHTPPKATHTHTLTIYPTLLLRLIVLALLSACIALFAFRDEEGRIKGLIVGEGPFHSVAEGGFHTIPVLIFLPLAALRTCITIAFPVSRTARWTGVRGLNAAVDAGLVAALLATTIVASRDRNWSQPWEWANKQGFVVAWIATSLYALAALDTGSPDRFYIKMARLSLGIDFSFRFGEDEMVTDKWDVEARDVARRL
ncbi:hypothetical protein VE03_01957 [Pseudogymnoascus sp. 23342-1-I1]|nr:hypothetical protein VE03_01957 [Pseudogymnoascus sp. 23342-1-I1]